MNVYETFPLIKQMTIKELNEYVVRLRMFMKTYCPLTLRSLSELTAEGRTAYDEAAAMAAVLKTNRDAVSSLYKAKLSPQEKVNRMNGMIGKTKKYVDQFCKVDSTIHTATPVLPVRSVQNKRNDATQHATGEMTNTTVTPMAMETTGMGRPQHLSQYIHFLPVKLQNEAGKIQQWYSEMAYAHDVLLALVIDNPNSAVAERAKFARVVCRKEERIMNFWRRVDVAWERLQGRVVDELLVKELEEEGRKLEREDCEEMPERLMGSYCKAEIDRMPEGETKEAARKARILRNQKFLRRTDRQRVDMEAYRIAIQELHDWGLYISEKQAKVAMELGVDVPKEYIAPDAEERKRIAKRKYEEKRKVMRKEKAEEYRKMKEEIRKDNPFIQQGLNFIE